MVLSGTSTLRRSQTPGRKPSRTTSASSSAAGGGSDAASQRTISFPALSASYQPGALSWSASPSGGSIFVTRAPRRRSSRLANGPGRSRVRSATATSLNGGTVPDYAGLTVSERSSDRRRDLLHAAIRVFAHKGFHASRVGDIAEEAGVAHGLLYHYFRSKEEVL